MADDLELLIRAPTRRGGLAFSVDGNRFKGQPLTPTWQLAATPGPAVTDGEAWDVAHEAAAATGSFVEPDLRQSWPWPHRSATDLAARPGQAGTYEPQSPDFPQGPGFAWHLGDKYTQLDMARRAVQALGAKAAPVRIGILDVGFDFTHNAVPTNTVLQRNFVKDQSPDDASDPHHEGPLRQPGHGTATIALLAGPRLAGMLQAEQNGVLLGANPMATIVPCRIGTSVIQLKTSAFVEAIRYLMAPNDDPAERVDVVSMSMGGLASSAWADMVNQAYEAGVVLVTAAGNNFGVPKAIVFPARFNRVIAACGVMGDGKPYLARLGTMSGNFGPPSKMATAMAAYTPNVPWAEVNTTTIVDMNGQGTSSATPQIAGAVSLWLAKHKKTLARKPGWQVVEAVRHALFSSARKPAKGMERYFGQGILRAHAALAVAPPANLKMTPPDRATFAFLRVLARPFGVAPDSDENEMLALEATQLFQRDPALEEIHPDPASPLDKLPEADQRRFFDAVIESRYASRRLRESFAAARRARFPGAPVSGAGPFGAPTGGPAAARRDPVTSRPAVRRLRVYGFDPSLSQRLDTADLNEATISIPWEPVDPGPGGGEELRPGPVGEYLEVVDHDPASGAFYAPVDLNQPQVLASDGLAPSDGNPRFHQQMVYAVAMRTIQNFETALGRKALWAPRVVDGKEVFVRRLRIYPHALRERNAFYHPGKKALLFGYFPAVATDPRNVQPGGMIFTCLSHDIVAHETTHALLDGMHHRFSRPTNPDVLAFHEAFADIVAIFQHFSLPGVLEARIASRGGRLEADELLGGLAQEFGKAMGTQRALRSALTPPGGDGTLPRLDDARTPHDRGAILLGAVFDAFIRIYQYRARPLIRAATGGNEELPAGPVNRDLAGLLAKEAGKTAQHVLNICIRALDYCPPVDLSFGDYLRALITADKDAMPADDWGYRLAFVEAFRRREIYPRDVRSMSVESLLWCPPEPGFLVQDLGLKDLLRGFADNSPRFYTRSRIFDYARVQAARIERKVAREIGRMTPEKRRTVAAAFGIDPALPFRIERIRVADKLGAYGRPKPQLILTLIQERQAPLRGGGDGPSFPFHGGATIMVDAQYLSIDYAVIKNTSSQNREERQRQFLTDGALGLRATYFADNPNERFAMLHRGYF